ncbi:glycoside hydrolase family 31 protein [soil metagenome]
MNSNFSGRTRRARKEVFSLALLLLFALPLGAQAAWRGAGDVSDVVRRADGVVLTLTSGARASITFISPTVVRVRLAPRGTFERDQSYAIETAGRKAVNTVVRETAEAITISMPEGATVSVRRRPFLVTLLDSRGRIVVEDDPARPTSFDPETDSVECSKRRAETETYYGLGEKAMPMSRHTQQVVMWNTDTYAYPNGLDPIYQSIPFFLALHEGRAYGLFLDNTYRTYFDMGKTAPERYTFGAAGGELNYYLFTGGLERSPKEVLRNYTELTGHTPLPPIWALGYQQSRWSYFPESRVREIVRRFREGRIPADVIYLDIDYMDGYRIFTWDKSRFPDPGKMISDFRADGFRTVIIVDPGVKTDENYEVYRQGRAGGYFTKAADGKEFHAKVWPGACAFPDYTDPRARRWFGSLHKGHTEEGVAGFWNDMNEPATFRPDDPQEPPIFHHPGKTFPLSVQHAGDGLPGDHARYHNVYGMQMARATFEGLRQLRPDVRPFVLTRAGYAGVQRYSAVWTGDNVASWEHLRLVIPMLANLGVSGVPLVGADVGGFVGSPSGELYARWLQTAALTPIVRSHTNAGSKDQEPWSYGPDFERINRATIELRYKLLPYLYSLFHEHTETGAPVMRPLWFEYPKDVRTYLIEDEYLVGRELLVAPVLNEGEVKRRVYFPKGDVWIDWWTGERHGGGSEAEIAAPLDRLPLFARAGAAIPVQPVVQHTGEMARVPVSVLVVPGADNTSRSYEDSGEGYSYQGGTFGMTTVTLSGSKIRLEKSGSYNSRPFVSVELLGVNARPREIRIGNRVVEDASFDERVKRLLIPIRPGPVTEINVSR